jgi:hypothetical protein
MEQPKIFKKVIAHEGAIVIIRARFPLVGTRMFVKPKPDNRSLYGTTY